MLKDGEMDEGQKAAYRDLAEFVASEIFYFSYCKV